MADDLDWWASCGRVAPEQAAGVRALARAMAEDWAARLDHDRRQHAAWMRERAEEHGLTILDD